MDRVSAEGRVPRSEVVVVVVSLRENCNIQMEDGRRMSPVVDGYWLTSTSTVCIQWVRFQFQQYQLQQTPTETVSDIPVDAIYPTTHINKFAVQK